MTRTKPEMISHYGDLQRKFEDLMIEIEQEVTPDGRVIIISGDGKAKMIEGFLIILKQFNDGLDRYFENENN